MKILIEKIDLIYILFENEYLKINGIKFQIIS